MKDNKRDLIKFFSFFTVWRTSIENVAGKDVPSADHQSLIPVLKAKCKNWCPIVLRPPKQKFKESAEDEFVPSAAIFASLHVSLLKLSGLFEK